MRASRFICPQGRCCRPANRLKDAPNAPVAQLDRALPSEGKGHTFESCRVRHFTPEHAGLSRSARFSDPASRVDPAIRNGFVEPYSPLRYRVGSDWELAMTNANTSLSAEDAESLLRFVRVKNGNNRNNGH